MIRPALKIATLVLPALAALAGGCKAPDNSLQAKVIAMQQENARLADDKKALQSHIDEQNKQIETLRSLGGEKRLEKLYVVKTIQLGRFTGGVGGTDEKGDHGVKVYLEPMDQHGSILKAAGEVKVEVYDLAAPPRENLVLERRFSIEEVAGQWFGGFGTYHYSFECDWQTPPRHDELTIRVEFTDYLTGQKFSAQTVAKIKMAPVRVGSSSRPASQAASRPAKSN